MRRLGFRGLRPLSVAAALALTVMYLQPQLAAAASITLTPSSGLPGSTVIISGSGVEGSSVVNVTFNGVPITTVPDPLISQPNGTFVATFKVPVIAPGLYTVVAYVGLAQPSAQFQVTSPGGTNLTLQKAVSVNGGAYGTDATAKPGDQLAYLLSYANTGTTTLSGVTITDQLQPGQTLQAESPGCSASLIGGLTTVTCPIGTVPPSPSPSSSGTVYVITSVNANFSGTISNTGVIYSSTTPPTNSLQTTVVTVQVPLNLLTLTKSVSVNGLGYGTSGSAHPGDQLTYALTFTNNSGSTAQAVVVSDVLQPGQSIYSASPSCTYTVNTSTVTCALGNIGSGSTVSLYIGTIVNSTFAGNISNVATASFNGYTITSNGTIVSVSSPIPSPTGSLTLCGVVTAYNPGGSLPGSLTITGITVPIAAAASVTGTIAVGLNECVTLSFNGASQAAVLVASVNSPGVGLACGVYTPGISAGYIDVGGYPISVAGGANFGSLLAVGSSYCFLVTSTGQIYGVLSGIPTHAVRAPSGHGGGGSNRPTTYDTI